MLKPFRSAVHWPLGAGPRLRRVGWMLAVPISLGASAQTGRAPDPADAGARVPPIVYASPLPGPAAAAPARVGSWREANDLTGRIGGWRAYAREAQAREAVAPAAAPAASAAPIQKPPAASAAPMHKH